MDPETLVIPGITDTNTFAIIARSRKLSQYVRMVNDALTGKCPFCTIDKEYNEIILENEFWYSWASKPPEANTEYHFLYVPKRHVTSSSELSDEEVLALWGQNGLRQRIRKKVQFTSCGTLLRDGDARLSAGTIAHLHFHDMIPNGTGRVESPFWKGKEAEEEGVKRAIVFEKIRQGRLYDNLLPEEQELVRGRMG